jgi:hypothetical protein
MSGGGLIRTVKQSWRARRNSRSAERRTRDPSGRQQNASEQEALTLCQAPSDRLVRKANESQRVSTYKLSNEGETSQDNEIMQAGEGELTSYGTQREGLIRTEKERQGEKGTHKLSSIEGLFRRKKKGSGGRALTSCRAPRAERVTHQDRDIELATHVLA